MADELPTHVVSAIAFVGRGGGGVKTLSGFRKPQHSVPDAANAATQAFLAKICTPELTEQAEQLFQGVRAGLAYKRKDLSLNVTSPVATLAAKDFSLEITYGLDASDPARYLVTTTLRELHDVPLARSDAFTRIFAGRFTEIEFLLNRGARVDAVIDAIEALDDEMGLNVTYPSDYGHCLIRVNGVEAEVKCDAMSLSMIFRRGGSPAELIDGFMAVRDAFQISKVLSGLIDSDQGPGTRD